MDSFVEPRDLLQQIAIRDVRPPQITIGNQNQIEHLAIEIPIREAMP